jgi:hypothetical protein
MFGIENRKNALWDYKSAVSGKRNFETCRFKVRGRFEEKIDWNHGGNSNGELLEIDGKKEVKY